MPRGLVRSAQLLVVAAAASALLSGCFRAARPEAWTVTVFVSGDVELGELAQQASVVNAQRQSGPCLWLVVGDVFGDRVATAQAEGDIQVRLLSRAGVDAVLFTPEWLQFGVERCEELVEEARFYPLGANIGDSAGDAIGYPMMVKSFSGEELGLVGAWPDTADTRLRQNGVRVSAADFEVRKTVPLLRRRAGLVGVLTRSEGPVPDWGVELLVGAGREGVLSMTRPEPGTIRRLDLVFRGDRILDYMLADVSTGRAGPDSSVKAALDSIALELAVFDSQEVVVSNVRVEPDVTTRAIAHGYLKENADAIAYDGPLAVRGLGPGKLTNRDLVEALVWPGRMVLVSMSGRDLKEEFEKRKVEVDWRTGLKHRVTAMNKEYVVAMTPGFLAKYPELAAGGFRLDAEPLWRIAARVLAKQGERS